jgi:hypothetical protein
MLNKLELELIKALRSGEYPQARQRLCSVDPEGNPVGYCCLGVACEVAMKHGIELEVKVEDLDRGAGPSKARSYDGRWDYLPEKVRVAYGWKDDMGELSEIVPVHKPSAGAHESGSALSYLNDRGASFAEIADVIEKELVIKGEVPNESTQPSN